MRPVYLNPDPNILSMFIFYMLVYLQGPRPHCVELRTRARPDEKKNSG